MINARDNPFSVDRVLLVRYEPQGLSWDELMRKIEMMDYRCGITGKCGFGKTTLIEDIANRLETGGIKCCRIFTTPDKPVAWVKLKEMISDEFDILILDGADHLKWWQWYYLKKFLFSKSRGLIITSHKKGMLPTLYECRTSVHLLRRIVQRLNCRVALDHVLIEELYREYDGNIRDVLRRLYDMCADGQLVVD